MAKVTEEKTEVIEPLTPEEILIKSGLDKEDIRASLGILNPSETAAEVTVKVYDKDGNLVKEVTYTIQPGEMKKIPMEELVGELEDGWIKIESENGRSFKILSKR